MPNYNRLVLDYFKQLCTTRDSHYIDCLIVSSYLYQHGISEINNLLIRSCILEDDSNLTDFLKYLDKYQYKLSIENLVEFFEFVISPANKETNGAIYTPIRIREYIVNKILLNIPANEWENKKFCDVACGCGGFFLTLAQQLHKMELPFAQIYSQNIFGIDIEDYSIRRCKILLSLFAIINGEDVESFNFNLYVGNSLNFNWNNIDLIRKNEGFDVIIGNPPYVSSSKISEESKALLVNWSVAQTGKTDLYIPFFQIAITALKPGGILGYITVNNFYRSLNGRAFRSYMSQHRYDLRMIDFESEQVFRGRSTYTCICFISKTVGEIHYCTGNSHNLSIIKEDDFVSIKYQDVNDYHGWLLCEPNVAKNIIKIEHSGIPLGKKYNIKNGFATLKNDIYLFSPIKEDNSYFILEDNTGRYHIEKEICREAVKPNILKSNDDLEKYKEILIFPYYIDGNGNASLIPEFDLEHKYPYAYHYLESKKDILHNRDKANRSYPAWYAYGRTQALNIKGYKLLFPYIADDAYFVLTHEQDLLFYNGYAIISNSIRELEILQRILQSKVFWYYIKHTSKPYGSNYYALAKNYVKNFGIPFFTKEEEDFILKSDIDILNSFLLEKYNMSSI